MNTPHLRRAAAIGMFAAVVMLPDIGRAQVGGGLPERFSATAIDQNRARMGPVEIRINRWSTDAERDRLMQTLLDKGPDKLLDALMDVKPVGSIQTPGNLAYDLRYARRTALPEGGERIVFVTDRRIGTWEAFNDARTVDYPFTVIELHLNRDGEGEGKMSLATRITADKENNIVVLENWDLQPVLLTNVKRESSTH